MPSFSWDIDRERSENHLSIHASSRYEHHRQSHKKRDWRFFSFPISIKMKRFFALGLSICSLNVHVTMK